MAKPIGTLGYPNLIIGERIVNETGLIMLFANTSSTNTSSGFHRSGSTTIYQVPGGMTFQVVAVRASANINAADAQEMINLAYSDTSIAYNSGSSPTNGVAVNGATFGAGGSSEGFAALGGHSTSGPSTVEIPIDFTIPASKYPFLSVLSGSYTVGVIVYGFEV